MTNVSDRLVRSGIRFLKDLQNDLGTEKGLEVWDKLREAMGDEVSGQVLFGILKGHHGNVIRLERVGENRINPIKLVREITGVGLKEAKDMVESVCYNGRTVDLELYGASIDRVEDYIRQFESFGCKVS